jgi:D-alanyl-D-alanine dipeptidase
MSAISMRQISTRHSAWSICLFAPSALLVVFALSLLAASDFAQTTAFAFPGDKPLDVPPTWRNLIGEYGPENASLLIVEKSGKLFVHEANGAETILQPIGNANFTLAKPQVNSFPIHFEQDAASHVTSISLAGRSFRRRKLGPDEGHPFQIQPSRPIADLRREALAATPPREDGHFRDPDLVDLTSRDPSIHLEISYATSDDFLGTPVYTQARAFLQRPAADALVRALVRLKPFGYGLLIHDAYRPWYVTKIFWDATPPEGKIFVADPSQGSRHNRGCAVDLTLYDLKTGKPIQMPGTYDEMSPRSFPDYPGGTSLQRWHRDLLRWAMESEGFTVYDHGWWHFDYKDWHEYPILNVPFEKVQLNAEQVR